MAQIIASPHRLSLAHIEQAAGVIDPIFLNSPQFESEPLSRALSTRLSLKVETLNPIRSFKGRGASFFAHKAAAALAGQRLVCASAGNWGQALAYVCRQRGWPLVVYSSTRVNPLKAERMRALGAELRLQGDDFDDAKQAARRFCADSGALFVEDGRETAIAEGAGTIAIEMLRGRMFDSPFDSVLIPLGDGALASGMGRWIKAHAPEVQVVGICARNADALAESWRTGRHVMRSSADTIADGIGVRAPVPEALVDLADTLDEVLLVSEDAMTQAMRLVFEHVGLVLEPAGAAGVAAVLEHAQLRSRALATVLTGSNVAPQLATRLKEFS